MSNLDVFFRALDRYNKEQRPRHIAGGIPKGITGSMRDVLNPANHPYLLLQQAIAEYFNKHKTVLLWLTAKLQNANERILNSVSTNIHHRLDMLTAIYEGKTMNDTDVYRMKQNSLAQLIEYARDKLYAFYAQSPDDTQDIAQHDIALLKAKKDYKKIHDSWIDFDEKR